MNSNIDMFQRCRVTIPEHTESAPTAAEESGMENMAVP